MTVFSVRSSKDKTVLYYLHSKEVVLAGKRIQRIYYFAKDITKKFALSALPVGYRVTHNERTGLPLLKKKKDEIQGNLTKKIVNKGECE